MSSGERGAVRVCACVRVCARMRAPDAHAAVVECVTGPQRRSRSTCSRSTPLREVQPGLQWAVRVNFGEMPQPDSREAMKKYITQLKATQAVPEQAVQAEPVQSFQAVQTVPVQAVRVQAVPVVVQGVPVQAPSPPVLSGNPSSGLPLSFVGSPTDSLAALSPLSPLRSSDPNVSSNPSSGRLL